MTIVKGSSLQAPGSPAPSSRAHDRAETSPSPRQVPAPVLGASARDALPGSRDPESTSVLGAVHGGAGGAYPGPLSQVPAPVLGAVRVPVPDTPTQVPAPVLGAVRVPVPDTPTQVPAPVLGAVREPVPDIPSQVIPPVLGGTRVPASVLWAVRVSVPDPELLTLPSEQTGPPALGLSTTAARVSRIPRLQAVPYRGVDVEKSLRTDRAFLDSLLAPWFLQHCDQSGQSVTSFPWQSFSSDSTDPSTTKRREIWQSVLQATIVKTGNPVSDTEKNSAILNKFPARQASVERFPSVVCSAPVSAEVLAKSTTVPECSTPSKVAQKPPKPDQKNAALKRSASAASTDRNSVRDARKKYASIGRISARKASAERRPTGFGAIPSTLRSPEHDENEIIRYKKRHRSYSPRDILAQRAAATIYRAVEKSGACDFKGATPSGFPSPDVTSPCDVSVPCDVPVTSDVPTLPLNVATPSDVSVPPDVPALPNVSVAPDIPVTPDVPALPLNVAVTVDVTAPLDVTTPPDVTPADVSRTLVGESGCRLHVTGDGKLLLHYPGGSDLFDVRNQNHDLAADVRAMFLGEPAQKSVVVAPAEKSVTVVTLPEPRPVVESERTKTERWFTMPEIETVFQQALSLLKVLKMEHDASPRDDVTTYTVRVQTPRRDVISPRRDVMSPRPTHKQTTVVSFKSPRGDAASLRPLLPDGSPETPRDYVTSPDLARVQGEKRTPTLPELVNLTRSLRDREFQALEENLDKLYGQYPRLPPITTERTSTARTVKPGSLVPRLDLRRDQTSTPTEDLTRCPGVRRPSEPGHYEAMSQDLLVVHVNSEDVEEDATSLADLSSGSSAYSELNVSDEEDDVQPELLHVTANPYQCQLRPLLSPIPGSPNLDAEVETVRNCLVSVEDKAAVDLIEDADVANVEVDAVVEKSVVDNVKNLVTLEKVAESGEDLSMDLSKKHEDDITAVVAAGVLDAGDAVSLDILRTVAEEETTKQLTDLAVEDKTDEEVPDVDQNNNAIDDSPRSEDSVENAMLQIVARNRVLTAAALKKRNEHGDVHSEATSKDQAEEKTEQPEHDVTFNTEGPVGAALNPKCAAINLTEADEENAICSELSTQTGSAEFIYQDDFEDSSSGSSSAADLDRLLTSDLSVMSDEERERLVRFRSTPEIFLFTSEQQISCGSSSSFDLDGDEEFNTGVDDEAVRNLITSPDDSDDADFWDMKVPVTHEIRYHIPAQKTKVVPLAVVEDEVLADKVNCTSSQILDTETAGNTNSTEDLESTANVTSVDDDLNGEAAEATTAIVTAAGARNDEKSTVGIAKTAANVEDGVPAPELTVTELYELAVYSETEYPWEADLIELPPGGLAEKAASYVDDEPEADVLITEEAGEESNENRDCVLDEILDSMQDEPESEASETTLCQAAGGLDSFLGGILNASAEKEELRPWSGGAELHHSETKTEFPPDAEAQEPKNFRLAALVGDAMKEDARPVDMFDLGKCSSDPGMRREYLSDEDTSFTSVSEDSVTDSEEESDELSETTENIGADNQNLAGDETTIAEGVEDLRKHFNSSLMRMKDAITSLHLDLRHVENRAEVNAVMEKLNLDEVEEIDELMESARGKKTEVEIIMNTSRSLTECESFWSTCCFPCGPKIRKKNLRSAHWDAKVRSSTSRASTSDSDIVGKCRNNNARDYTEDDETPRPPSPSPVLPPLVPRDEPTSSSSEHRPPTEPWVPHRPPTPYHAGRNSRIRTKKSRSDGTDDFRQRKEEAVPVAPLNRDQRPASRRGHGLEALKADHAALPNLAAASWKNRRPALEEAAVMTELAARSQKLSHVDQKILNETEPLPPTGGDLRGSKFSRLHDIPQDAGKPVLKKSVSLYIGEEETLQEKKRRLSKLAKLERRRAKNGSTANDAVQKKLAEAFWFGVGKFAETDVMPKFDDLAEVLCEKREETRLRKKLRSELRRLREEVKTETSLVQGGISRGRKVSLVESVSYQPAPPSGKKQNNSRRYMVKQPIESIKPANDSVTPTPRPRKSVTPMPPVPTIRGRKVDHYQVFKFKINEHGDANYQLAPGETFICQQKDKSTGITHVYARRPRAPSGDDRNQVKVKNDGCSDGAKIGLGANNAITERGNFLPAAPATEKPGRFPRVKRRFRKAKSLSSQFMTRLADGVAQSMGIHKPRKGDASGRRG